MRYFAVQRIDFILFGGFLGLLGSVILEYFGIIKTEPVHVCIAFFVLMIGVLLARYLPWGIGDWLTDWIGIGKRQRVVIQDLSPAPHVEVVQSYSQLPQRGVLGYLYLVKDQGVMYRFAGPAGYLKVTPG